MGRPAVLLATSLLCSFFVLGSLGGITCQDGITIGYMDVAVLRNDLLRKEGKSVFTLCPETTFDLINEPLEISRSVHLKCGDNGLLLDSCIFEGGESQVRIEGDGLEITFQGLTFLRSEHTSVSIVTKGGFVTFSDCLWQYHGGNAVAIAGDSSATVANTTGSLKSSIVVVAPDTAGGEMDRNRTDVKGNVTDANASSLVVETFGKIDGALQNSTDVTSSVLGRINGAEASRSPESAMMANGTGNADDILLHSPNASNETAINRSGAPGDVVEGPTNLEGLRARMSPSRIRQHSFDGDRQLSSRTGSVSIKKCTFLVSYANVLRHCASTISRLCSSGKHAS